MLITLSGLDGAGKSTLAEALKAKLEKSGTPAAIFHMNKDVGLYAFLRSARDALTSGKAKTELPATDAERARRRGLLARIVWNKSLRRWVDVGDLATFLVRRFYIEKIRGRVLIMDRYFYDRLADQADGRRWTYLRWFARITPAPDVPVFVEVSPNEAFARKGEYSIESMTQRRAHYATIFSWVPTSIVLVNDQLDVAVDTLGQIVASRMRAPRHQRVAVRS